MEQEIWKPIENFPNYQVSNFGNVINKNGEMMKQEKTNAGYFRVTLCKKNKHKHFNVHILVAKTFNLPRNPDQTTVDHIDTNIENNHLDNLRWATRSQQQFNRNIQKNNTTGYKGVYFERGRYRVRVWYNGKNKSLGTFDTPEQASEVREKFAQEIHGEFYRPIFNHCNITINN